MILFILKKLYVPYLFQLNMSFFTIEYVFLLRIEEYTSAELLWPTTIFDKIKSSIISIIC